METPAPEMSAATKSILTKVQRLVPPMLESFHKGESYPMETTVEHATDILYKVS
jgi:hypothetical protein